MARWADDPERAVGLVLADVIAAWGAGAGGLADQGPLLAVDLPAAVVCRPEFVAAANWSRRVQRGVMPAEATPWPHAVPQQPGGAERPGYARALVRLPRAKAEVEMTLAAVLSRMAIGGQIWLAGGNDEGIRSGAERLESLVGRKVDVLARQGHGRVVRATLGAQPPLSTLADWRTLGTLDMGDGPKSWVSYPGLFNKGALDAGTRVLVEALPPMKPETRVLDFGSGPGAIAAALLNRVPSLHVTLLDNDTVALEAARENVPRAKRFLAAASLDALGADKFDFIVSNPPIHDGFREDFSILHALIETAPRFLARKGTLIIVVQRRLSLDRTLAACFKAVEVLADDGRYRVFRAADPKA